MKLTTSKEAKLILSDGVELRSTLWMPTIEGPWPALLMRQPYCKEIASTVTYAHPSWWASQGYLVIIQDVRGQGESTGEFMGFPQESSDTTATHAWVRSLPECNGLLGTYGFSYQGLTQLLADPGTPPPNCIAAAMTGLRETDWTSEGGAYWWHLGLGWGLQLAAQKLKRNKDHLGWEEIRNSLENKTYLTKGPELLKKYDSKGMAYQWLLESKKAKQTWGKYIALEKWLKQPLLLVGGWYDPHLKGIIDIYQKSLNAGGNPEIHIGPATHMQWWEGVQQMHLKFFNKHLRSGKNRIDSSIPKKIWNITAERWHDQEELKAKQISWSLFSKGLACIDSNDGLLREQDRGDGFVLIVHDPWRPAPAIGGHLSPRPGFVNRQKIDVRNDVAIFTSAPLKQDIRLEGLPKLKINASSDREGFDLCIAISILDKKKIHASQISTGVLRILGDEARTKRQREVIMQPFLADITKDSSIRLSIAGAAWPAIGINPGNKKHCSGPPSSNCLVTTISLDLSHAKLEICPLLSK